MERKKSNEEFEIAIKTSLLNQFNCKEVDTTIYFWNV